jgi:hypothetical protein
MATKEIVMGSSEAFIGVVGTTVAVSLGELEASEIKIKIKGKQVDIKTMMTGEGILKTLKMGETAEIEIPIQHEDKFKIWTAMKGIVSGTTAVGADQLSATDPFAGNIYGGYSPGGLVAPLRLVIRQYAVDDSSGTTFSNNATNPLSIEFYKVVPDEDSLQFNMGVKDTNKHTLKFKAQYDMAKTDGKRLWNFGVGIATT